MKALAESNSYVHLQEKMLSQLKNNSIGNQLQRMFNIGAKLALCVSPRSFLRKKVKCRQSKLNHLCKL